MAGDVSPVAMLFHKTVKLTLKVNFGDKWTIEVVLETGGKYLCQTKYNQRNPSFAPIAWPQWHSLFGHPNK